MKIPVFALKEQFRKIKREVYPAVSRVLESGFYILGRNVGAFEDEFSVYCGASYGVGVASGTDALILALRALDIKRGDEVITTPFTFFATSEAICSAGARIVFADINLSSYTIDPEKIEKRITRRTKAILCVHLYGQPCDMSGIIRLAARYKLKIVEDCAQATGAEYKNRKVGTLGAAGAFSFYPTKNLGAYGDGGMVITDNKDVADAVRNLRVYGSRDRCHYPVHGYNSRLDELQAAILRVKLKHLDKWNEARRKIAAYYNSKLASLKEDGFLVTPKEEKYAQHAYHLYVIRAKKRDALRKFLDSNGITTAVHYPLPLHPQRVYKELGYRLGDFPNAELAAKEIITLPLFPELTEKNIDYIAKKIGQFYRGKR
ncbi:MAG: DegT/DnrJ/EryC1/StrS family aminotransferase [Candidatus Omnitrophota bacterium]